MELKDRSRVGSFQAPCDDSHDGAGIDEVDLEQTITRKPRGYL